MASGKLVGGMPDPNEVADRTAEEIFGKPDPRVNAQALPPAVEPPAPTLSPDGEMEMGWIRDDRGQWTETLVPKGQTAVLYEEKDRHAPDPMGLGPDWDTSRGEKYHARWANANPNHRIDEIKAGYAPVLAENVPPEIRNRFQVTDKVPGFEGQKCLVFGDAVLMEMPKAIFEARYARAVGERRRITAEKESAGDAERAIENRSGHLYGDINAGSSRTATNDPRAAMADAQAEAEAFAFHQQQQVQSLHFGGFQGDPRYNNTTWGQR